MRFNLKILFIVPVFFSLKNICYSQTINTEKKIIIILDSLNQEYLWKSVPEDFMSAIPPAGYEKKYPHRMKLFDFQKQLAILMSNELSESFLIRIYDKENISKLDFYDLTNRLLAFKSQKAYNKLYSFFKLKSIDKQLRRYIGLKLLEDNQFRKEIRQNILSNSLDYSMASSYLNKFDKETDKLILNRIIAYMKLNLDKNPFNSYGYVYTLEKYFNKRFKEDIHNYIKGNPPHEELMKQRYDFYKKCSENAIKYYDTKH